MIHAILRKNLLFDSVIEAVEVVPQDLSNLSQETLSFVENNPF